MPERLDRAMFALKLKSERVEGVPDSYSSEVYRVTLQGGDKVIVKIPYSRLKLYREAGMLRRLRNLLPVPELLDVWEGDEQIPGALLLSCLPGHPISGPVSLREAFQMGALLASLHEVAMPGYGTEGKGGFIAGEDWRQWVENIFNEALTGCTKLLDPALMEHCILYFEQLSRHFPAPDGPCAIHLDYRPGNLLTENDTITGLIDFESARGGAAEIDFTKMKLYVWDVNPGTRKAFTDGYRSIRKLPEIDFAIAYYSFFNAFLGVDWCYRRGANDHASFLEENTTMLRQLVNIMPS